MINLRDELDNINSCDPTLMNFMEKLIGELEKQASINKLVSRVQFLEKKVNDIEKYSSEDYHYQQPTPCAWDRLLGGRFNVFCQLHEHQSRAGQHCSMSSTGADPQP